MLIFIALCLIVVGVLVISQVQYEGKLLYIALGSCILGIVGLFAALLLTGSDLIEREIYEVETQGIYSLERNSSTEGSFILGTGSFDSKPQYVFYLQDENGYFQLEDILAKNALLSEDDSVEPSIITRKSRPVSAFWDFMLDDNDEPSIIVIPENSIVQEYRP
jgi:hypothetical protein